MSERQSSKRSNSLVWKLAFLEVKHLLSAFAQLNLFVILLFCVGMLWWGEWRAGETAAQIVAGQTDYTALSSDTLTVSYSDHITGISMPRQVDRSLGIRGSTYRSLELSYQDPNSILHDRTQLFGGRNLHYVVSLPRAEGGYHVIRLDFATATTFFAIAFIVLFLVQVWIAFWSMWDARRAIHNALKPIYDLTLTARSITAGQQRAIPLSGAIDTLNAITGDAMDQRIAIEDEREELQGLATAINSMLDRLDAAYRSQLRFVSDASHELRTPIAIIQGYVGLLDRWGKDDPDTLREAIDAIKTEAHGMQDLIEQLLFLARSDNRSIPMQLENLDLSGLMQEVVRETEMIDKVHPIVSRIDGGLHVKADVQLIKQAVRILVDNALKYTPDGGRVTIGAKQDGREMRVWVSDEGVGIAEEDLPQIFERFWRADEARTRNKKGGTGLGLSIAQWIVDSHNGRLETVSRKDIGTRITILLPAEAAATPVPPSAPRAAVVAAPVSAPVVEEPAPETMPQPEPPEITLTLSPEESGAREPEEAG